MIQIMRIIMATSYEDQFNDEHIEKIPNPSKTYYLSPNHTAKGFTYLFKLLSLIDMNPKLIDILHMNLKDIHVTVDRVTALQFVCRNYKSDKLPEVVKILIDNYANSVHNAGENYYNTPLYAAVSYYQSDKLLEVVQLLVAAEKYVDRKDILHVVCVHEKSKKIPEIIKILIDAGTDVNYRTRQNMTSLHITCKCYKGEDSVKIIQTLIDKGADINITNSYGNTPLHYICANSWPSNPQKGAKLLINNGINIDAKNSRGSTALHIVCGNQQLNKLPLVRLLIKSGANLNTKDARNNSAFQCIFNNNKTDKLPVMQLLIKAGADLDVDPIVKINNQKIYDCVVLYHKNNPYKIKPFLKYFSKEQTKLLECFSQFKTSITSIENSYNDIHYCPNNIGSLLSESNFSNSFDKVFYSNKLLFLFN